ncbi:hypothetical protein VNO78_13551 [Psophocarpus tetragonolobus]|uniref:TCP domain-containing protein n=1 Tax=Psophocarpus tetragonolobus TaxID=3891 RepID=A0AAN9XQ18_PSOTE
MRVGKPLSLDPPRNQKQLHHHQQQQQQQQQQQRKRAFSVEHAGTTSSSRQGMVRGGEIVEVEGGHIVRSTGRKDRHSKVCTAKGPRDRRVRLSAHTAIQFYDVQDRLGYDRPSKAVDWLINKAKSSIDQLAHLPPWKPQSDKHYPNPDPQNHFNQDHHHAAQAQAQAQALAQAQAQAQAQAAAAAAAAAAAGAGGSPSSYLPLDNDALRSFFPTTTSSLVQFQTYPPDLLSRTSSQDLRLSLQSLQDPILLHHNHNHPVLFAGPSFHDDNNNNNNNSNNNTTHTMGAWNSNEGDGGGGGFAFNASSTLSVPATVASPAVAFAHGYGHGQSQYFSQRGPLQSSNTPSVRAWIDAPSFVAAADHHHRLHHHYLSPAAALVYQSSPSTAAFAAPGGFSGFRVPARIQGEEEHDGMSDKPSSASSDSRR